VQNNLGIFGRAPSQPSLTRTFVVSLCSAKQLFKTSEPVSSAALNNIGDVPCVGAEPSTTIIYSDEFNLSALTKGIVAITRTMKGTDTHWILDFSNGPNKRAEKQLLLPTSRYVSSIPGLLNEQGGS